MRSIAEADYGTPNPQLVQLEPLRSVRLQIDDRTIEVPEGTSVLRAA